MNLNNVIEKMIKKALRIRNNKLAKIEKAEANLELVKNEYKSLKNEIAEKLGNDNAAVDRLKGIDGKRFTIKARLSNNEVVYENQALSLSQGFKSVKIGNQKFPLVGKDCIVSIYDEERKCYIYNNTYLDKPPIIQKAYAFGLKFAESGFIGQKNQLRIDKTLADVEYRKSCVYIESMDTYIKEGYKFINPLRRQEWDDLVMGNIGNSKDRKIIIDSLRALKSLNDFNTTRTVEDVERVLNRYPAVADLVIRLSNRDLEAFNDPFYVK